MTQSSTSQARGQLINALLIPLLAEALRHLALFVNLHELDLHAGDGVAFEKGDPPLRVLVDAGDAAGLALLEDGAGGQGSLDGGVDVVDGEAGMMQPLAVLGDELGEAVIGGERLAELDLGVAEVEVGFAGAALDQIARFRVHADAEELLVAGQGGVAIADGDSQVLDTENLHAVTPSNCAEAGCQRPFHPLLRTSSASAKASKR